MLAIYLWIKSNLKLAGAIIIALAVAYLLWQVWQSGADFVTDRIEQQNEDAGDAADQASRDRDDCVADGGVWSSWTGQCRRP